MKGWKIRIRYVFNSTSFGQNLKFNILFRVGHLNHENYFVLAICFEKKNQVELIKNEQIRHWAVEIQLSIFTFKSNLHFNDFVQVQVKNYKI